MDPSKFREIRSDGGTKYGRTTFDVVFVLYKRTSQMLIKFDKEKAKFALTV